MPPFGSACRLVPLQGARCFWLDGFCPHLGDFAMHECRSLRKRRSASLIATFISGTLVVPIALASDILQAIIGNRTAVAHKLATLRDPDTLSAAFSADSAKVLTASIFRDTLHVWTWQHGDPTNHTLT